MMLGEIRTGINEHDPRGVWAYGHAGGNLLAAHGSGGDANGPNPCNANADDVWTNRSVFNCNSDALELVCMTCFQTSVHSQGATRSPHPGGVMTAMCDGHVEFITDDIEISSGSPYGRCCSPWDWLVASGDEQDREQY